MFNAIYLEKPGDQFKAGIVSLADGDLAAALPDADVTVAVEYSTINYKDGLALTNKSPIVRKWPMVAGIDAAGTIVESGNPAWKVGTKVVLNGCGVGESTWGGLAQKARFKGDWLVALPAQFTTRQSMAIGTAGFTAALCILALERYGIQPGTGDVLVTGATGGVGSIAVTMLAARGYRVVASTGKLTESEYLKSLGAASIIDRAELTQPGKPLQKERWAAVVDSVGSHTLVNACAQTVQDGAVAACGLAQGMDLPATVAPFILRGVALLGVNSVVVPRARREAAWKLLAQSLDRGKLDAMTREVALAESFEVARDIVAGRIRGRVVVDVNR
jgi:acrylyl-CoA reductase (NADPH)